MAENTYVSSKEYQIDDAVIIVNRLFSDSKTVNELISETISAKNTTKTCFDML